MESEALRLELRLDARPALVSVTRRFVEETLERYLEDADLVSRVAMSAHELLENAAKYARGGSADLKLNYQPGSGGADGRISVRLANPTSAPHIDRLREMFMEIDRCEDPLMLYVSLMRRNATKTEVSGLGLARIRAEGEMTLDLKIQGDVAVIVAETNVPATPAGGGE